MQKNKALTILISVAALSGTASAKDIIAAPAAGAEFLAKGKDTISVTFSGRNEFQYSTAGEDDGMSFRRLRFGTKAKLNSQFTVDTVIDFTNAANGNNGAGVGMRKAIVSYKLNDMFKVKLGRDKVAFGYEETSSSSKGVFLERSNLNDNLDGRVGYDVQKNITIEADWGHGFSSAFSFVNDGNDTAGSEAPRFFGRLQWSNDAVTLGGDFAKNGETEAYTLYAAYQQNGLSTLFEWFDADFAGAGDTEGFSARASYKWDQFEPVVRYSNWEIGNQDQEEVYVGLNYYVAPQVTLLTGYTDQSAGNIDSSEFTTRLRVLW